MPLKAAPLPALRRGIELRDLWFRYSDDHPWICGASAFHPVRASRRARRTQRGGEEHAGQTALPLLRPDQGAILWDGVDIRDATPPSCAPGISAVFQDHMSYDLSAAETSASVTCGAWKTGRPWKRAARQAGVHDRLARYRRGYETPLTRVFFGVSEEDDDAQAAGVVLSGGQWQRVAIARAILRDQP